MMGIDEILKKLDGLFKDERLEEVEPFLLSCMRQAKAGNEYGIYISVGNELIGFYRSISRYEEAFAVAEDVLLLMEAAAGGDSPFCDDAFKYGYRIPGGRAL